MLKKFVVKILILSLPWVLFLLPFLILLKSTGEYFTSIDPVIFKHKKTLTGYMYNEKSYNYIKWKSIQKRSKSNVLALGSSRVLQFREEMFDVPFYNAGFTINGMADFLLFLKNIPKNKFPDVLIIGLDQWMFNEEWNQQIRHKEDSFWKNSHRSRPSLSSLKSFVLDVINGKYSIQVGLNNSYEHINPTKIGLNAVYNNTGLRNDGSMFYGRQIDKLLKDDSTAADFLFEDTFSRISNGDRRFQHGSELLPRTLLELEELLQFCKENNVFVIGFLPPFAGVVYSKMDQTNNYSYISKIDSVLPIRFRAYGFEYWNFSDVKPVNSNDDEFIDGFHGGEVTYLKMLIHMINGNSQISKHTNLKRLKSDLIKKKNNYQVYAY